MNTHNIIFIMADDHAAKAISAYGEGINKTPSLIELQTKVSGLITVTLQTQFAHQAVLLSSQGHIIMLIA